MEIDFDKMQGLAPAVIQDERTGELLMVGFMNCEALDKTLRTGFVTFYSRTRQTLWTKGESSGNRLQVVEARTDCDRDTVLLRVRVLGEGGGGGGGAAAPPAALLFFLKRESGWGGAPWNLNLSKRRRADETAAG